MSNFDSEIHKEGAKGNLLDAKHGSLVALRQSMDANTVSKSAGYPCERCEQHESGADYEAYRPLSEPNQGDDDETAALDYGRDFTKSADFFTAIEIWKAKQDPRYTTITVSTPNLMDWSRQGWNGMGNDNIMDGPTDDSSSEEPGQMPFLGEIG